MAGLIPRGIQIERAIRCLQNIGAGGGGVSGLIVELVIAVEILSDGDIEGRAGIGDQHWAYGNAEGRLKIATEQETVANIEAGAAVVGARIGLIGWEVTGSRSIGIREVEHVEAKKRNAFGADCVVEHDLILVINATGLVLINVFVDAVGANAGASGRVVAGRDESVDVVGVVLMYAMRAGSKAAASVATLPN